MILISGQVLSGGGVWAGTLQVRYSKAMLHPALNSSRIFKQVIGFGAYPATDIGISVTKSAVNL